MMTMHDSNERDSENIRRLMLDAVAVHVTRQVLELAHMHAVPIAPVKGVVLSRWLYEHVFERPYVDVDFLVGRSGFVDLTDAVESRGWPISYRSDDLGDLHFRVDRLPVEVHAEFSRRDLSLLSTDEVLARAQPDRTTFAFEVLRLDDIDHFLLLVANVTRKAFTYANAHQPGDLERYLERFRPRWQEVVGRTVSARLGTAVRMVAEWMVEEHHSKTFAEFARLLPRARQPVSTAFRLYRRFARKQRDRLESATGLLGLALATLTPDDRALRARGLSRVVRRGLQRRLGRDPG
jgi:hypothetical protein